MSLQQFHDAISAIITDQKSGKLYVNVRHNGLKRVATILVKNGEVVEVSYHHQVGKVALENLLPLDVEGVIFIPTSAGELATKNPDLPTLLNIAKIVRDRLMYIQFSSEESMLAVGGSLLEEAQEILKKVYGPTAFQAVEKIAKTFPPDQNPQGFLDRCQAKARLVVSKSYAEKLFKPLYDKLV